MPHEKVCLIVYSRLIIHFDACQLGTGKRRCMDPNLPQWVCIVTNIFGHRKGLPCWDRATGNGSCEVK